MVDEGQKEVGVRPLSRDRAGDKDRGDKVRRAQGGEDTADQRRLVNPARDVSKVPRVQPLFKYVLC